MTESDKKIKSYGLKLYVSTGNLHGKRQPPSKFGTLQIEIGFEFPLLKSKSYAASK